VSGFYTMVNPGLAYTIQNLIFQWTTSSEPDGLHQFEFQFFNASGGAVASPAQVITLKLDNQPVTVSLIDVLHAGAPVPACAIVNLTSATDGVQIVYEAYDPEGDLYSFAVTAQYGHGLSATIYSDSYAAHVSSPPNWQGVMSDTRPVPPAVWVPPGSCAYLFQIAAYSRTTDGYSFPVSYSSDFQTVTLIKPGSAPLPLLAMSLAVPGGFPTLEKTATNLRQSVKALT